MYDDVDVGNYPAGAQLVAGYLNGTWPTAAKLPDAFPGVPLVTIDVNGQRPDADVLDMEWGDATPAMCPSWAAAHFLEATWSDAIIYCSLSRVQEVLDAFAAANDKRPIGFWTAHYTGKAHVCDASCGLPAGAKVVGTQYADPATSGGQYDVSLWTLPWP